MNAFLVLIRYVFAQREKFVLGAMVLLCGVMAFLALREGPDRPTDPGEDDPGVERPTWTGLPRRQRHFAPASLENSAPLQDFARLLEQRASVFRPGEPGAITRSGNDGDQPWPDILVRQVSQPTPGGGWIAQLEIDGKLYIGREGRVINKVFEIQRIDKTRLCVEIVRRLDDETQEFCKE